MDRQSLRLIHEMEQQKAAIDHGDKGRFETFDDQCVDYLRKLVHLDCFGAIHASPSRAGNQAG